MRRLTLAVVTVALAGLLFGFDTAVVAGVTDALRIQYALSPAAIGITVSSALWGTLLGAIIAGMLGNRIGSRNGLQVAALFYLLSGLGCAFAPSWGMLLFFRVLCGFAVGVSSVLAPIYLSEIAPARQRGSVVGLFQVALVIGIVTAYLSNMAIGEFVAEATAWRWKLGVTAVPALLFAVLLRFIPDSPRWLFARGRERDAERAMTRLYGHAPSAEFRQLHGHASHERISWVALWQGARRPILLAVTLAAFNQLTGINAILYYLNDIFAAAGFDRFSSDLQAVAIGVTNLVFTLAAMVAIDRLGRRRMLLAGSAGMAAMLGVAALVMYGRLPQSWLLGVLVLFIAFFAFSQGAIVWVYISEIFPTRFRAAGQGIGSATIWLFDGLVAYTYPVVAAQSKGLPFVFFMGVMVCQGLVVWFAFPETKGATLEEIDARMATGARR